MIRRIHCEACDKEARPMHPEDVAMGWKRRRVEIIAKKPAEHTVTTTVGGEKPVVANLPSIYCDQCGDPVKDGERAVAITEWQTSREGEPGPWEQEYASALRI